MSHDLEAVESRSALKPLQATQAGIPIGLYVLFFFSGISGLMYEVVWVRLLTRILGSTVYATSTALAAFMAGLALGSFLIGRFIDRVRRPLVWYMVLELGIGLAALLSLSLPDHLMPAYRSIYALAGGSRAWLTAGQVGISLVVLLLPTTLMGATLPTLSAYGARYRGSFGRYVGLLYALNTAGAVTGVLTSGFVLIGAFGEATTLFIGVAINASVAVGALVLASREPGQSREVDVTDSGKDEFAEGGVVYGPAIRNLVIVCFATGGFVSLAYEVVWSRMLVVYQGTSIYAFSSMLAVILTGMALGSYLAGLRIDRWRNPLGVLTFLELAVAVFGAVAIHLYPLPNLYITDNTYIAKRTVIINMFLIPGLLVGPMGFLWGMIFPVMARCYMQSKSEAGRSIGTLYAWNTIGCIAGSLVGGFVLIPLIGASQASIVLVGVSLALGIALLLVNPYPTQRGSTILGWVTVAATIAMLGFAGDPYFRLIRARASHAVEGKLTIYHHVDQAAGTTTAFGGEGGRIDKHLWVNGVGMTRLGSVTKLLSHLPIWMTDDCKDVLVICLGMGTSLRSAASHPGKDIHVVELIPATYDCIGYFHKDGRELLNRTNVHPHVDDGRNFLLMNTKKYDVITIDPAPPLYAAGTVNLHTQEFFELCRARLNAGGKMCLWIPPYGNSELPMIIQSFLKVFKHVKGWSGGEYSGFILIGGDQPIEDAEGKLSRGIQEKLPYADLVEWGDEFGTTAQLMDLYLGDEHDFRRFVGDIPAVTDDHPYLEFPLWRMLFNMEAFYRVCDTDLYREKLAKTRAQGR